MADTDDIELSVVVPVYRSAPTLPELWRRLGETLDASVGPGRWEAIFVDDESPDDSWSVLEGLTGGHPGVKRIRLMRNFGQHNAIMCGFHHAAGRFVATIDDDLQHEPESVPRLLEALHLSGDDLIYGVYETKRHGGGRNLGSALVNRFYRLVFGMPVSVTSFRVLRRELVRAVTRYDLNFTYLDGLMAWNTRRIGTLSVPHHARVDGRSGYTLSKLVGLAMNVFANFSLLPLQAVSAVGLGSATIGVGLGLWFLGNAALGRITVPGYASLIVAVLVLGGLQMLSLGILGEYLGRLHLNVNRKPQYTVRTVAGAGREPDAADKAERVGAIDPAGSPT